MRTTLDLPEDHHGIALGIARHTRRSLSQVVAELMRRGLQAPAVGHRVGERESPPYGTDPITGLPQVRSARPITPDDVHALDDEP